MMPAKSRLLIENEILERLEKRYSEEEQANHLMYLLTDNYPLRSASILAVEPDGGVSVFAHRGLSGEFIKGMYARPVLPVVAAGMAAELAVSAGDPRSKDPSFRLEHPYGSLFAAPCRYQGETVGVFLADSDAPDLLAADVREAFRAFARLGSLLLSLRNLRARISRVPDVDSVTGLASFKHFHEVLHRELTRGGKFGHPVSVAFLKIRGLREMNGVFGHVASDKALAEAAGRIRSEFREVDYLARAGGTIYAVLPNTEKPAAMAMVRRILDGMDARPVALGDIALKLAAGVAEYPKDGDAERVLLPHIEAAVRESMRRGGNAATAYGG